VKQQGGGAHAQAAAAAGAAVAQGDGTPEQAAEAAAAVAMAAGASEAKAAGAAGRAAGAAVMSSGGSSHEAGHTAAAAAKPSGASAEAAAVVAGEAAGAAAVHRGDDHHEVANVKKHHKAAGVQIRTKPPFSEAQASYTCYVHAQEEHREDDHHVQAQEERRRLAELQEQQAALDIKDRREAERSKAAAVKKVHEARNAQIEARLGLEKKVKTDTRVHMEELTKQRQKNDEKRDEDLEKQHRETNQRVPVHDNVQQSRKSAAFKGRTQRAQALRHWFQSPKSPLQSLP